MAFRLLAFRLFRLPPHSAGLFHRPHHNDGCMGDVWRCIFPLQLPLHCLLLWRAASVLYVPKV